jgi:hypothetical protein
MRLEIIIDEPNNSTLLLKDHPPKDGDTQYACGFRCIGSWAGRIEQHAKFIKTPLGKYIKKLEMKPHGGKRPGAGRKPKEPTTTMRVPKSKVQEIKNLIKTFPLVLDE